MLLNLSITSSVRIIYDWKEEKIEKGEIKKDIIIVVAIASARCIPLEIPFKVTVSLP